MALDVHVMPMRRYFTGDFLAPLEKSMAALGASDKYHRTAPKWSESQESARAFVETIQRKILHALGPVNRWRDEGDVILSHQLGYAPWHALRAFAADFQYPTPGFIFDENSDKHPELSYIMRGQNTRFPHLIRHADNRGFWLPVEFDNPFDLLISDDVPWLTGSSIKLRAELNFLGGHLNLVKDIGQDGWEAQLTDSEPLALVKRGWVIMRYAARMSVQSRLPIVFDG